MAHVLLQPLKQLQPSSCYYSCFMLHEIWANYYNLIPKPELRVFGGYSLTKPPFGVTSAKVAIICPVEIQYLKKKRSSDFPGRDWVCPPTQDAIVTTRMVYLPT